jgi:hypothetical protein
VSDLPNICLSSCVGKLDIYLDTNPERTGSVLFEISQRTCFGPILIMSSPLIGIAAILKSSLMP